MWAVKLQQMQDGRLYIAGIGAGIENTPDGMQSQVLLAADRIAMINPANGNTKPMFVGQGDQIFMNEDRDMFQFHYRFVRGSRLNESGYLFQTARLNSNSP